MNIIAFEATTDKGVIKIPEQYLKSVGDHVQVILVLEKETKKPANSPTFTSVAGE